MALLMFSVDLFLFCFVLFYMFCFCLFVCFLCVCFVLFFAGQIFSVSCQNTVNIDSLMLFRYFKVRRGRRINIFSSTVNSLLSSV